ncbi:DUF3298 and DUF4163 domain-containing protein [Bacillus sp. FJAT-22090]|uniref:DUF3298 and DUF4163 domain-containing protein n=1 Tax=Bacillus sp. FJAT-22090 TaxID=1581038 RepID=UPI0011A9BC28|nr:DUF3298 and DUF4163 domain-containing protein [Bacillus sp. FJAT-22090]
MNLPVRIETKRIFKQSPNVNVYYPIVSNLPHPHIEKKINGDIITLLNKMLIEQGFYAEGVEEITGYYEIKNNQRGILSILLIVYTFSGGAHGLTLCKSLTFDVTTGKMYTLRDLFKPNSDYVKTLSGIINKKIIEWDVPLLGEFKEIRKDQDYYIADHCLVIYFQLYEITPYVYNFPFFPIVIKDIEKIVPSNGPLEKMLYF